MKKPALLCLAVLLYSCIYAQNTAITKGSGHLKGKVLDTLTAAPLEYATITVINNMSGKTITGGTSSSNGQFQIDSIAAGNYRVLIEFIGYKPATFNNVNIVKGQTVDLKNISLSKNAKDLATVTVTAQPKLVENKIDKLVFNAEKDITSAGGVATDILKKVPQVSVDVDGNVQLAGNGGIRFLINGKPSTAFGSSIADVLQSLPASQIKSIEVITNPGARYDAQGMGGIINIILKTNSARGINGNLSLTAGTRQENGSFNFNARKKNVGFNAFVSGNTRLKTTTNYNNVRTTADTANASNTLLQQSGNTSLMRYGIESGMGVDWTYQQHNNFSASVNYNVFGNSTAGLIDQTQQASDYSGGILSKMRTLNNTSNKNRMHTVDFAFNYKRTFSKEDQELEFSANSSFGHSRLTAGNEQFLLPQDSLYYGVNSANPGKENETQLALDYVHPVSEKIKLGTGLKTTLLDITSNSDVLGLNNANSQYIFDPSLSNSLQYHQQVYGAYAEISFPVANWFDVKAGGRYERTEITSAYSNAQQHTKTPGYNTFVPSVFLLKKLGDKQSLKLSYSKRIERPDYGDLNPFINTADPKNITAGNPYLLPELGQRVEMSYGFDMSNKGSFTITAFYRHNMHDIQPYVKYYPLLQVGDSAYYNVSVSTRENIGTEDNTGLNIFSDLKPISGLSIRTNLAFFHRKIFNAIDVGQNRTSFNYRLNLNASYQFSGALAAEFFGNFNSARNEVQGKYPSLTTYSFAVRKQFWHKKGSLALTAINPFNEYVKQKQELYGANFSSTSVREIPFRSIGVNFTWKFGLLEFKKEADHDQNDVNSLP